ncbi:MAG: hypothetical protein HYY26_07075 [Acidobacteria bacterium]|nr:hypothetical protein [Acidobacteriota bacterium]
MRRQMLVLALAVMVVSTLAWAHGGEKAKSGKMDPAAKAAMLKESLGLTDAQTEQVRAVFEETHKRYTELKAQGLTGEALMAEKKKLKAEQDAKLKSILNAEQWAKYEELRSQHERQQASKQ